jgi:catalase
MKKKTLLSLGFATVTAFSLAACTKPVAEKEPVRKMASASEQPSVEQGEIWTDENETQTAEVIATNERMLLDRAKDESFLYRDAHPKEHGCVKAEFNVDSSALPPELRVGVFSPNSTNASKFSAWVRFSNGNPDGVHAADIKKDIRGMAIKLMNVDGSSSGSQDFVMLTSKEFFSKNADDYIDLHRALSGSKIALPIYLGTHPKQAWILLHGEIQAANPLQVEYFSSVPYKLGTRSMKFKARPCETNNLNDEIPADSASPNYLRERLVSTLQSKQVCYEFLVQPNMDPNSNLIEDPTIAWDESVSPYIKVATLVIPQQTEIDSEAHLNFCENLSFNPWHTLPDTRPLGQINRMRLEIYPAISKLRHLANHIPIIEPKSQEICTGETAPLCQTPKR